MGSLRIKAEAWSSHIYCFFASFIYWDSRVSRSNDGSMLVVSSTDGYCSILHFDTGELGKPLDLSLKEAIESNRTVGKAVPTTPQNGADGGNALNSDGPYYEVIGLDGSFAEFPCVCVCVCVCV